MTWVGDGVGGLLGGDKAYRKLTLKHHPDKMKSTVKVVLNIFIFWKLACEFPGSPERPTGMIKAVFVSSGKWPLGFLEALNVQRACSRLFVPVINGPRIF